MRDMLWLASTNGYIKRNLEDSNMGKIFHDLFYLRDFWNLNEFNFEIKISEKAPLFKKETARGKSSNLVGWNRYSSIKIISK